MEHLDMQESDFHAVAQAVKLVEGYDRPWAVCGGWALDLYLDRVTRPHRDVDFAVLRRDQRIVQEYLFRHGWSLEKAVRGGLAPWPPGEWIDLPVHTVWCRNPAATPDFIELLFNEADEDSFFYRRDLSISLPLRKMIRSSPSGIPILAPEIVLLYKSVRPEDPAVEADFRNVLPGLSREACGWLAAALQKGNPAHPWLEQLPYTSEVS